MKIKYEAVDGKIFNNKNDCIEYETYIDHQFFLVHLHGAAETRDLSHERSRTSPPFNKKQYIFSKIVL